MSQATPRTAIPALVLVVFALTAVPPGVAGEEALAVDPRLEWFVDGKLGIFIHWGIYAVNGIPESWSFFNGEISYEDYMKQMPAFTAERYDPEAWAALFEEAGARYAVLTAKHHDGFALWPTELSELDVMASPAKRDLLQPYADALRARELKVGLYFSHLDWSHPDYASVRYPGMSEDFDGNRFAYPPPGTPDDPVAWERFIRFHRGQIKELSDRYRPDLFWFDGDWERGDDKWDMAGLRKDILTWQPDTILNGRMKEHGDYETPEQGLPIFPPEGPWEFCMTINDSWGYQVQDHNHKPTRQIIRTFAEIVGGGGNLLLDVGPYADGSLQPEQVERLKGLGRWTKKHAEAIYGTRRGLPFGHYFGPSALSKDGQTLYLFVFDIPRDAIAVKGVRNEIERTWVVGSEATLTWTRSGGAPWKNIPGVLLVDVPQAVLDEDVTVIGIELKGPLDLYHGAGGAIEAN